MTPEQAEVALRRWSPRRMYPIYAVGVAIGLAILGYAASAAVTGSGDGGTNLPPSVERLIPEPGSEAVAQSMVGIDLAVGYSADLLLNGVPLTDADGIAVNEQLAAITFKPGENTSIARLPAGENCVAATIRSIANPNSPPTPVSWCFSVS